MKVDFVAEPVGTFASGGEILLEEDAVRSARSEGRSGGNRGEADPRQRIRFAAPRYLYTDSIDMHI